jgi:peptide/nickel transport system ATP-binding protein
LLEGDLPSPTNIPTGCRFRNRCPKYRTLGEADQARCVGEDPQLHGLEGDHQAACHFAAALEVV